MRLGRFSQCDGCECQALRSSDEDQRAGLMLLAQACVPWMTDTSHRRKIIALSSHGSHRALPAYGLIGASKAALESLARHLAMELGNQGINVNIVFGGFGRDRFDAKFPGAAEAFEAINKRRFVSGRPLSPEEVAGTVLFLASSLSDLVQGQTVIVDGGEALHG